MKKIILLFSFLLFIMSYAQESEIDGIGVFKFNKFTTTQLDSLMLVEGRKLVECNDKKCQYLGTSKSYVKLLYNSNDPGSSPSRASASEAGSVYVLSDYMILGKYKTDDVVLSFYKDVLVRISMVAPTVKLSDDLEIKYGKPELDKMNSKSTCYIGSESFSLPEDKYVSSWTNSKEGIVFMYVLTSGYATSGCDKKTSALALGYHKASLKTFDDENSKLKKELEKKALETKKQTLSDL